MSGVEENILEINTVSHGQSHRPGVGDGLPNRLLGPRGYTLERCDDRHADRSELEAYVRRRFADVHCADIRQFLPQLLALRDRNGALRGVAGYRDAASERLFLEQYLDLPAEQVAAAQFMRSTSRSDIAEIGNFACESCRHGKILIDLLVEFLDLRGHRWAMFTGTQTIRQIMLHMGIEIHDLAGAQRSRLGDSAIDWGRYYDSDPRVVIAVVPGRNDWQAERTYL